MIKNGKQEEMLLAADYRQELGRMNRELLFHFLELADTLVHRPQDYARTKDGLTALVHNMQFLVNSLRAHQVRTISQDMNCWML